MVHPPMNSPIHIITIIDDPIVTISKTCPTLIDEEIIPPHTTHVVTIPLAISSFHIHIYVKMVDLESISPSNVTNGSTIKFSFPSLQVLQVFDPPSMPNVS
jgi:hypothetical protein